MWLGCSSGSFLCKLRAETTITRWSTCCSPTVPPSASEARRSQWHPSASEEARRSQLWLALASEARRSQWHPSASEARRSQWHPSASETHRNNYYLPLASSQWHPSAEGSSGRQRRVSHTHTQLNECGRAFSTLGSIVVASMFSTSISHPVSMFRFSRPSVTGLSMFREVDMSRRYRVW
jgi:hypothetical protein